MFWWSCSGRVSFRPGARTARPAESISLRDAEHFRFWLKSLQDAFGSFKCVCPNGFEGDRCEVDIDECAQTPCSNGGRCSDMIGDFKCLCPSGYSGRKCEVTIHIQRFRILPLGEYRACLGGRWIMQIQTSCNLLLRVVRCSTSYEYWKRTQPQNTVQ